MVARLSENHAHLGAEAGIRLAEAQGSHALREASMGELLLRRATELENVAISPERILEISGTPLSIAGGGDCNSDNCFISGDVFAVISHDGSICLRLPDAIGNDLVENGLCLRAGRNLLTWPPENSQQLEVAWRILLHAYWNASGTPSKRSRRLWSEWVINH